MLSVMWPKGTSCGWSDGCTWAEQKSSGGWPEQVRRPTRRQGRRAEQIQMAQAVGKGRNPLEAGSKRRNPLEVGQDAGDVTEDQPV